MEQKIAEQEKEEKQLAQQETKEEQEVKPEEKGSNVSEAAKSKKEDKIRKTEAVVRATLPISKKYSMALCRFINGKTIDEAFQDIQEVIVKKKAVKITGEIGHKKSMGSGRYPIKAAAQFNKLLRNLNANASYLGVNMATARLSGKANDATRRRAGKYKGKNTHLIISLRQIEIKPEITIKNKK